MSTRSWRRLRADLRTKATPAAVLSLVVVSLPHAAAAATTRAAAPTPNPLAPTAPVSATALVSTQQQRIAALPDSATISSALIWSGRLLDPTGAPTTGTVVAYVRPNGSRLASLTSTAAQSPTDALIPVAHTTAAADGSFVLRADYSDAYSALADKNGSLTLMLVANTDGALGMQMKTVWWAPSSAGSGAQPAGASAAGGWSQSDPTSAIKSMPAAVAAELNPNDIQLQPTPAQPSNVSTASRATHSALAGGIEQAAGIAPPGSCIFWQGGTGPDMKAYIGDTYLQKSTYWEESFAYTHTNTSSFQVGWSAGAGGAGASFTIAGSETTSSTNSAAGQTQTNSNANSSTSRKHYITVHSALNQWRCWNSPTTPPASPGEWPQYLTLEPGAWARDFAFDQGNTVPACNTNVAANQFAVGGQSSVHRDTGSSTSISSSISGSLSGTNGGPISFTFGAAVTNDNTLSDLINYAWSNSNTSNKTLCGVNGAVLSGNTQVVAIGTGA